MKTKKTILILNWRCPSNPLSGGAEKVTLTHARAWKKNGFDVTWLSGNYKGGKPYEILDGVKVYRIGTPFTVYLIAPFIYWIKFAGKFDLVIDEIHGLPFLSTIWAWKSQKLAYIHEVAQEIWDEMFPFPINLIGKTYEKLYFHFYRKTKFLTGSESTKQDLVNFGVDKKNIKVLEHGLFLKPVTQVQKKEKNLTLLFIGRLVRMKGIENTIKIFKLVHEKNPTSNLWVVGNGEQNYIKKIKKLVNDLKIKKHVTFYGYIDEENKIKLLQKAHFLIHTSIREGFGLTVIEANSQGTPVLGYNNPGLNNVIKNGINGYMFDPDKNQEIVKKCLWLYNDSQTYNKLAATSITDSSNYDWQIITNKSLEIIQQICKNGP